MEHALPPTIHTCKGIAENTYTRRHPRRGTLRMRSRPPLGTSLVRSRLPLGPYCRPIYGPAVVLGGGAAPYERGTPVAGYTPFLVQESRGMGLSRDRQACLGLDRLALGQTGPPQDRQARLGIDRPASGWTGPPRDGLARLGTDRPASVRAPHRVCLSPLLR
ncbi:hypothetical protein T484DRAFT_2691070 [Baffinella frigidus]|nr:hypothetical protein T484DRAFT_2691070 [Cryptophyta sp. CCMP2293]